MLWKQALSRCSFLPSSAHLSKVTKQSAGSSTRLWKRWAPGTPRSSELGWRGQFLLASLNELMASLSEEKQQMEGVIFGRAVEREPFRHREQSTGKAQRQSVSWHSWRISEDSHCFLLQAWSLLGDSCSLSLRFTDETPFPTLPELGYLNLPECS